MPKPNHREALIKAGLQTMFQKGYIGASVRDVVSAAGVPQGSFTNHFASKEAFAGEVLDAYFEHVRKLMADVAAAEPSSPRRRVIRYLDLVTERMAAEGLTRGCLIGDLSAESPGHSEQIRERLREIYREWSGLFAEWMAEAQRLGELSTEFSAETLANFLITGWEGAIARMKVERTRDPLDQFRKVAFATVLEETV